MSFVMRGHPKVARGSLQVPGTAGATSQRHAGLARRRCDVLACAAGTGYRVARQPRRDDARYTVPLRLRARLTRCCTYLLAYLAAVRVHAATASGPAVTAMPAEAAVPEAPPPPPPIQRSATTRNKSQRPPGGNAQ